MVNTANLSGKNAILQSLSGELHEKFNEKDAGKLELFTRHYYAAVPDADLEEKNLDDLYYSSYSCWKFIHSRKGDGPKLRVFNPDLEQYGWQSAHTIVEVLCSDMPFLVDSIRTLLRDMDFNIHTIHSSVFYIARDNQGKLVEFEPAVEGYNRDNGAHREAVIYFEVDKKTDQQELDQLVDKLEDVLAEVFQVVSDFTAMEKRISTLVEQTRGQSHLKGEEGEDVCDFLQWLLDDNFMLLGIEEYSLKHDEGMQQIILNTADSLGIGRVEGSADIYRNVEELPLGAQRFINRENTISFAKGGTVSRVHRPAYPDYVSVQTYDEQGSVTGECRIIGLYTSPVYQSNPADIPIVGGKLEYVLKETGFEPGGHNQKDLSHVLVTYPREGLFLLSREELLEHATGIMGLQERRVTRLFLREDPYGQFISCLLYMPRDDYNTEVRIKVGDVLRQECGASSVSFSTYFSESVLVRVEYNLRMDGEYQTPDVRALEQKVRSATRTWDDDFHAALIENYGEELGTQYANQYLYALPASYREDFSPRSAVVDIKKIAGLEDEGDLAMSFYRSIEESTNILRFKLFRRDTQIPLSDVLPILENLGLRVIGERPYEFHTKDGVVIWVHDFSLLYSLSDGINIQEVRDIFQEAFSRIWYGDADNDSFNNLVLGTRLDWREIAMLRSYAAYLKQIRFGFGRNSIAETLSKHLGITRSIVALFNLMFDPAVVRDEEKIAEIELARSKIMASLDEVSNLNEDRILRRYLDLINATLRTNFFQTTPEGDPKSYISFKFFPEHIPDIPQPCPKFEIFVYSPKFEAVHLRSGNVSRGGLRWSDRLEDYRTEVLGLVKAQQVKNSVIVPLGAKGGFVLKNVYAGVSREKLQQYAVSCYQKFMRGMLDITDNLVDQQIVPPMNTVVRDDPDPYLVVAADKGTATFSDIANGVSKDYGFWLGDAFASGGSEGYDHKQMGITAKGAWISVQRHFCEQGIDIQNEDITVAGIGDMSGDVFGNGMLLSRHIRLQAAFNHRHIFLDPDPDAAGSYEERERLYSKPGCSWDEYNEELISKGGGVFSKDFKSIPLTDEVKDFLGVNADQMTPTELINAILKAPVDLIWNGGIGTYVKSTSESHGDVGDKANDVVRINGTELRCKVFGEGGNLGLTQLARIEYCLNGGACNSDFIDNAGGVDCSDHEVNIKILLDDVVKNGDLTEKQRSELLEQMTEDVGVAVLKNNYSQAQALSLAQYQAGSRLGEFSRYMDKLVSQGQLDTQLEFMPDQDTLNDRRAKKLGLTRPELAILISYCKNILKQELADSEIADDPYLAKEVFEAFPKILVNKFQNKVLEHRLYKELMATQITNDLVNHMGITFVHRLNETTGSTSDEIAKAYITSRDIYRLPELWQQIELTDHKIACKDQLSWMMEIRSLTRRTCRWILRSRRCNLDPQAEVTRFSPLIDVLRNSAPQLLKGQRLKQWKQRLKQLQNLGVTTELANEIACIPLVYSTFSISDAAQITGKPFAFASAIHFALEERLGLYAFAQQLQDLKIENHWQALARESFMDEFEWQQRALTIAVLESADTSTIDEKSSKKAIDTWMDEHEVLIGRWEQFMAELNRSPDKEYAMFSVAIRKLFDLSQGSIQII
ncbi:MAG: NAD-glutamate dehydrogenase [Pseudomonadales bacterium]|nr:NAD-glutamate dehydrogenase [Pseudomonadales bacterium]